MAKNNRQANKKLVNKQSASFKNVVPKVNANLKNATSGGIESAAEITFDTKMAEQFKKALPENKHQEFRTWLEKFASLGNTMKQKIAEAEKLKDQLETEQFKLLEKEETLAVEIKAIQPQLEDLDKRKKEINNENAKLKAQQEVIQKTKNELVKKEQALEEREFNARSEFAKEREESLSQFKQEISQLELSKSQLDKDIYKLKNGLTETQKEQEAQFLEKENDLEVEQKALKRKQQRLEREWKDIENERNEMQEEINDAIQKERESCSQQIRRAEEQSERAYQQVDDLQSKLDQYQDLERKLGGQSPEILQDELDELRSSNKALKNKLNNTDTATLEEENKSLKAQIHHNESRLKEVEPELSHLKSELSRQHLGIMDKQRLVEEKKVLEKHKQVLTAQLNDLSTRIDQLTESQQAQSAFPALSSMDQGQYETKPHLEAVPDLEVFASELQRRIAYAEKDVILYYKLEDIQLLLGGLAMSQLHVFQGISGTGKTSLAKAFAKAMGGHCTDIAVQAGWRDRDDLLGHYNAFEKRFYEKDCLQGLYQAQTSKYEDRCNIILLDEMNLSRPEQYFAEFLSALEKNNPNERLITLAEAGLPNAPKLLVDNRKIKVPENVWFIGTANHDETTNELADKTYDRSHVMILPRHESGESLDKIEPEQFSYSSLRKQFKQAQQSNKGAVEELLLELTTSDLTEVLESRFDIGWGNRFERQALQFIPVVMAAGGSKEMALDHFLATRVFRHGKVTARYDISVEDLDVTKDALLKIEGKDWNPSKCLDLLSKDKQSKERGA